MSIPPRKPPWITLILWLAFAFVIVLIISQAWGQDCRLPCGCLYDDAWMRCQLDLDRKLLDEYGVKLSPVPLPDYVNTPVPQPPPDRTITIRIEVVR